MPDPDAHPSPIEEATRAARERRFDDAAVLVESILETTPTDLRALDLLGFVRFFQGHFAEAETACRRALAEQPDHAYALKGLGLCLARQGQLDEGITQLEAAIATRPEWFDPYWDLAVVLHEDGRHEDALKILARAQVAVPAQRRRCLDFSAKIRVQMEGDG